MNILVVFTGGTIGSTVTDEIIKPTDSASFVLLNMYKQFCGQDISFTPVSPYNILSENINGTNMNLLYNFIIKNNYENYDGVIVTTGTDTLQYVSSFLGYKFCNTKVPVVIVSANYPLENQISNGFENFCGAVNFIKLNCYAGVFVAYKNSSDYCKIHCATRLIAHNVYSDNIYSILDLNIGYFRNDIFIKNKNYNISDNIIDLSSNEIPNYNSKILNITPSPLMMYPTLSNNIKAIMFNTFHSGTLNTKSDDFNEFCKCANEQNIPIYLAGCCKGFYYESKELYKKYDIKYLPVASPISMYIKLCFLDSNELYKVGYCCSNDIITI